MTTSSCSPAGTFRAPGVDQSGRPPGVPQSDRGSDPEYRAGSVRNPGPWLRERVGRAGPATGHGPVFGPAIGQGSVFGPAIGDGPVFRSAGCPSGPTARSGTLIARRPSGGSTRDEDHHRRRVSGGGRPGRAGPRARRPPRRRAGRWRPAAPVRLEAGPWVACRMAPARTVSAACRRCPCAGPRRGPDRARRAAARDPSPPRRAGAPARWRRGARARGGPDQLRGLGGRLDAMLQRQSRRSRQETRQLARTIADQKDAPRLERLERRRQVEDRFHPRADDQGSVGAAQLVQVGGDIKAGRRVAVDASQAAGGHDPRLEPVSSREEERGGNRGRRAACPRRRRGQVAAIRLGPRPAHGGRQGRIRSVGPPAAPGPCVAASRARFR